MMTRRHQLILGATFTRRRRNSVAHAREMPAVHAFPALIIPAFILTPSRRMLERRSCVVAGMTAPAISPPPRERESGVTL
ncbi:hypothetical protein IE81DRAFT_161622 [Ceraceosorus guamensis]|uniref:Uncharacterized protein n=1 Tax=Ceraceosorus guamensis TaxID=1522189 RepID=A0A316W7K0_9BASI|nr:hypothetical protein IE81DRAFT_161622 [Ceraceosorus guamensis]PWN45564.1 hypothetical protein IE81DRAFT_161622 [Ceraceosorus guamensis]